MCGNLFSQRVANLWNYPLPRVVKDRPLDIFRITQHKNSSYGSTWLCQLGCSKLNPNHPIPFLSMHLSRCFIKIVWLLLLVPYSRYSVCKRFALQISFKFLKPMSSSLNTPTLGKRLAMHLNFINLDKLNTQTPMLNPQQSQLIN